MDNISKMIIWSSLALETGNAWERNWPEQSSFSSMQCSYRSLNSKKCLQTTSMTSHPSQDFLSIPSLMKLLSRREANLLERINHARILCQKISMSHAKILSGERDDDSNHDFVQTRDFNLKENFISSRSTYLYNVCRLGRHSIERV
jgi:hypothetical protein